MNIFILLDNKIGHKNQALAIADLLEGNKSFIDLEYNILHKMPCFLLARNDFIYKNDFAEIRNITPDIVIACGTKTLPKLRNLKKQYPRAQTIYIMKPECGWQDIDIAIIPKHDAAKKLLKYKDKIIYNNFVPNIVAQKLKDLQKNGKVRFADYNKNKLGILIGGTYFNKIDISKLIDIIYTQNNYNEWSIITSTSRRTDIEVEIFLKDYLRNIDYLFAWHDSNEINPYFNILNECSHIIVTGDSLSMISDAICSGKKIFILNKDDLPKKHKKMIKNLFDNKLAFDITEFNLNQTDNQPTIDSLQNLRNLLLAKIN